MSKNYSKNIEDLHELRARLASGSLSKTDVSVIDQLVAGHIELQKSLSAATEKIGDKVVLAKLPFGVDLVK